MQFQNDNNGKSQEVFQLGALQLFLSICLPLMLVTFVAWYGWNDSKLPFEQEPRGFPTYGENFYQRFCELQWKYCVPIFQCGIAKKFDEKRILPIHTQKWLDQGGNATIYELVVHGAYNQLHRGPWPTVSDTIDCPFD